MLAQGRVADIEKRLRYGAVLRVRVLGEGEAIEAARAFFAAEARVASAAILGDGQIELGFRGDDAESAELLAGPSRAGIRIASFARAASDLEELFLQVTSGRVEPARGGRGMTEGAGRMGEIPAAEPIDAADGCAASELVDGTALSGTSTHSRFGHHDAGARRSRRFVRSGPASRPSASRSSVAGCAAAGRS